MVEKKAVYSVDEFAEIVGVSKPTVYNFIMSGSLPYLKIGKHTRITATTVGKVLRGEITLIGKTKEVLAARNERRNLTVNVL